MSDVLEQSKILLRDYTGGYFLFRVKIGFLTLCSAFRNLSHEKRFSFKKIYVNCFNTAHKQTMIHT